MQTMNIANDMIDDIIIKLKPIYIILVLCNIIVMFIDFIIFKFLCRFKAYVRDPK